MLFPVAQVVGETAPVSPVQLAQIELCRDIGRQLLFPVAQVVLCNHSALTVRLEEGVELGKVTEPPQTTKVSPPAKTSAALLDTEDGVAEVVLCNHSSLTGRLEEGVELGKVSSTKVSPPAKTAKAL